MHIESGVSLKPFNTFGLPAIARHLALTRGLHCTGEQVIVVNGPLQALETSRAQAFDGDADG